MRRRVLQACTSEVLCSQLCASWLAQVLVTGLLEDDAHIVGSFQVCTSWVHVVDAVLWPASAADSSAVPDPTPGGVYPADHQQSPQQPPYPTAAALWCAHSLTRPADPCCTLHQLRCMHGWAAGTPQRPEPRFACCWVRDMLGQGPLSFFAQSPQSSLLARSLIDLPPLPPEFARYTRACSKLGFRLPNQPVGCQRQEPRMRSPSSTAAALNIMHTCHAAYPALCMASAQSPW